MGSTQTIPVFTPDGKLVDIPEDRLAQAVAPPENGGGGGTPAVKFQTTEKNEDGTFKTRYIPAHDTAQAVANGGKLLPFEQQDVKHPGFWAELYNDTVSTLHGMVPDSAEKLAKIPNAALMTVNPADAAASMMDQARDAGVGQKDHSAFYRAAAPAAASIGMNVPGSEESARTGDVGGVLGHATAAAAPYVVPEVLSKIPLPEGSGVSLRKPAAAILRGASDVIDPELTGVVSPRLAHAQKLAGRIANALSKTPEEILDATGENKDFAGETEPPPTTTAAAKKKLPAAFQGPGATYRPPVGTVTNPFKTLSDAPPRLVMQAVDELGTKATQGQILDKVNELQEAPNKLDNFVDRIKQQEAEKAHVRGKVNSGPDHPSVEAGPDVNKAFDEAKNPPPKKGIDTDRYASAMKQARTELGADASIKDVMKRRDEIVGAPPDTSDVGAKVRQENPEPTRAEVNAAKRKGPAPPKSLEEPIPQSSREAGGSGTEEGANRDNDILGQVKAEHPDWSVSQQLQEAAARANPGAKKIPLPEAPQIKARKQAPTAKDLAETEAIREKVKQAAEAEDKARLREVYGERRLGSDVSTPKGVLTGVSGPGEDVYLMHPRGEAAPPDFTKLTKDVATPQQASRQLENLQKAGASANAINDFKMRAARAFGENWEHVARQHDDLTQVWRDALDAIRKKKNPQ